MKQIVRLPKKRFFLSGFSPGAKKATSTKTFENLIGGAGEAFSFR
ncbi:MAG TPA: hypothetical protein VIT23_02340 [Terrimicrobiaceae bacterium]